MNGRVMTTAAPDFAAGGQSEELTRITLAVKGQLGLGEEYGKFSGSCTDLGVLRYWQLSWSGEGGSSLDVTADNGGKILTYARCIPDTESAPVSSWEGSGFDPSFPPVDAAQVEAAARVFLSRVVSPPESVELEPVVLRPYGSRRWVSVSGRVLLHAVASPLTVSLRLSLPELTVTAYDRRDAWNLVVSGEAPSAVPAVAREAARDRLNALLSLELRYVDGEKGGIALRYVPTTRGSWYIDAQTGQAVDLSELPGGGRPLPGANRMFKAAALDAAPAAGAPTLSPVEQETVDRLAGALSPEELDARLRQIVPLGLAGMTRAGAGYYMDQRRPVPLAARAAGRERQIICRLTYTRPLTANEADPRRPEGAAPVLRKYITVDAGTGALLEVSTNSEWAREAWTGDADAVVRDFLSGQYPAYFAACVRKGEGHYVRQIDGIPYYGSYLRASVCKVDGTIGSFSLEWGDNLSFPARSGIVDARAALEAYAGCFETKLFYTAHPEKVDQTDPQWLTYAQRLGDVRYRWVLSYVLDGDTPRGVDPRTGRVLTRERSDGPLAYTDLDGCPEAQTLAACGVGFGRGDKLWPGKAVTQRDMLVLLLSAVGCTYDPDGMKDETEDALYAAAVSRGLLGRGQRDPDRTVTRLDFLKTVLAASPYGPAARLRGIYRTDFSDAAAIPAADLGYAAIGQALGMVSGALAPDTPLTRRDAAVMLCRFMGR